jgi:hypothetical protein
MKIYRDNPETLEEHLTAEGVLDPQLLRDLSLLNDNKI